MFTQPKQKHNQAINNYISLTQVIVKPQLVENCDIPKTCYNHVNILFFFKTGKHLMNRNDDKLTNNSCSGGYLQAQSPKIHWQSISQITRKPSLLICTKILLQCY